MNASRIEALLLEALDYDLGPVPQSLIHEALSLVNGGPVECDGGRFYFTDAHTQVPWLAVLVKPWDRYGSVDRATGTRWLINKGSTLIEFWDRRFPHDDEHKAQFVQRYYLSTFNEHQGALSLDGSEPNWRLSARTVRALQQVVK